MGKDYKAEQFGEYIEVTHYGMRTVVVTDGHIYCETKLHLCEPIIEHIQKMYTKLDWKW